MNICKSSKLRNNSFETFHKKIHIIQVYTFKTTKSPMGTMYINKQKKKKNERAALIKSMEGEENRVTSA